MITATSSVLSSAHFAHTPELTRPVSNVLADGGDGYDPNKIYDDYNRIFAEVYHAQIRGGATEADARKAAIDAASAGAHPDIPSGDDNSTKMSVGQPVQSWVESIPGAKALGHLWNDSTDEVSDLSRALQQKYETHSTVQTSLKISGGLILAGLAFKFKGTPKLG